MSEQTAYIPDVDLGILGTVEIKVEYDYQPSERQTHEYPGCDEEYEINKVYIVAVPGKFWPSVAKDKEVQEVLIDVTALNSIDYEALIDLIKEQDNT